MPGVLRIGDSVSCGDHSAQGSANVFANGMPITHQGKPGTTGHSCYPPTVFISGWAKTVYVNNCLVGLKGETKIIPHRCGHSTHPGTASTGSSDVLVES